VIVDGKRSQEFTQVTLPTFSSDSKHVAYAGYADGKWSAWHDGVPGPSLGEIVYHSTDVGAKLQAEFINNQGGFSGDGRHFGYVARQGDQWYVVVDDKEYGPFRSVMGFTFAGNGGGKYHFGFVAIRNRGDMSMIVDGKERAGFESLSMPSFSADGNHLAYFAIPKGKHTVLVRDDKETALDHLTSGNPLLSHDGAHIAYAVPGTEGQGLVYLDQQPVYSPPGIKPTVDTVRTSLRFTPNGESVYFIGEKGWCIRGKRNLDLPPGDIQLTFSSDGKPAYMQITPGGYVLVFDGHAFPAVSVPIQSITFSPRGDIVYYTQEAFKRAGSGRTRVYVNGVTSAEYEYDSVLPNSYNARRFFFDTPDRFHYFAVKDGVIKRVDVTIPTQTTVQGMLPQPASPQQPVPGARYHGLVISLECEKSYRAGQPVLFKVIEKNTGEQTLRYAFYRFPYYYHLYLTDARGKPVEKRTETIAAEYEEDHPTPINRPQSVVTLKPGEEKLRSYDLRQYFKRLPPGTYTLQVRRTAVCIWGVKPDGSLAPFLPGNDGVRPRGALSLPCQFTINE